MIQELIDAASPGSTVVVPPGTYDVDGASAPVRLKSGITLDLSAAAINILPTTLTDRVWLGLVIMGCDGVTILGGSINGNRWSHPANGNAAVGALGHGVAVGGGSTNFKIIGTTIFDCFGDGIYIVGATGGEVDRAVLYRNRRQGLTAADVDGLEVRNSRFSAMGGAPPGAGINLEPDVATEQIKNVRIEGNTFSQNAGAGVLIACPPAQRHNVTVVNNAFEGKPIDGTDGIVPFYAKWYAQVFHSYQFYPKQWSTP